MRKIVFAIVFISPPILKKLILRWFCGARFGRNSSIGWFSSVIGRRVEIGDYSSVKPFTLIRCDGEVRLGNYSEVSSFSIIYGCANLQVGNKCYIGPQTWINVSEDVVIGNGVGIGPRTMIFTHGSFLPYTEGYPVRFGKVTIGDSVWIPAGVFVHPGVQVGDNVLVNSRSVLKKSIPSGQYVEGFPAKQIRTMEEIRRPVTPPDRDELISHILKHFISFLQKTNRGIQVTHSESEVSFLRARRQEYLIVLLRSNGTPSLELQKYPDRLVIVLLNSPHWKPPINTKSMFIFDFITMKTPYATDRVHRELYLFLKMYYGIIFEFEHP